MKKGVELGEAEYRAYGGLLGLEGMVGVRTILDIGKNLASKQRQALIEGFATEAAMTELGSSDRYLPPYSARELNLIREQRIDLQVLLNRTIARLETR